MKCGVVVNASGKITRGWALISDEGIEIPVNSGDEVIEFQIPHGEDIEPQEEREKNKWQAVKYQDEIIRTMRTRNNIEQTVRALRSTPIQTTRVDSVIFPNGYERVYRVGQQQIALRPIPPNKRQAAKSE